MLAAALGASLLVASGCKGAPDRTAAGDAASPNPGSCTPDPLRTNLAPLWNGLSVDIDDCPILDFTAKYNEPDAMIFKAIIYVESRFQYDAVGCTGNGPCCPAAAGRPAHPYYSRARSEPRNERVASRATAISVSGQVIS
jgi:hypothetical protein